MSGFDIESIRKLSKNDLRARINELLAALEAANPEERELISYKADFYIRELDRKRDYWSWVSTRDLILEIVVIALIGWEIFLSIRAEHQQSDNFDAQQKVLKDMQTSTKDTATTLGLLKTTTETMSRGVERNAEAAEASSNTAKKSLVLSERAYVSASATPSELKTGEHFTITTTFQNSGKTPAIDFTVSGYFGFVAKGLDEASIYQQARQSVVFKEKSESKSILGPSQNAAQRLESIAPLTDADVTATQDGSRVWYIFVDVNYKDIFDRLHVTKLCEYYDPSHKSLLMCHSLNKAD